MNLSPAVAANSLIAQLTKDEPLIAELQDHCGPGPLGQQIHHPLVIEPIYAPMMNARLNVLYAEKRKAVFEALYNGEYARAVFLHERPYRLGKLLDFRGAFDMGDAFWRLVGDVWTDSENIWQDFDDWTEVMSEAASRREQVMSEADREAYAELPDTLTVYRGYDASEGNPEGLSWTLNRRKAEWFGSRFGGDCRLASGTMSKLDVIAHFVGRGEAEIVTLPQNVFLIGDQALTEAEQSNAKVAEAREALGMSETEAEEA